MKVNAWHKPRGRSWFAFAGIVHRAIEYAQSDGPMGTRHTYLRTACGAGFTRRGVVNFGVRALVNESKRCKACER